MTIQTLIPEHVYADSSILHLDEVGYGPQGLHTRLTWRKECLTNLLAGANAFNAWQDGWKNAINTTLPHVNFNANLKTHTESLPYTDSFIENSHPPYTLDFVGVILKDSHTTAFKPLHVDAVGARFTQVALFTGTKFFGDTNFSAAEFIDYADFSHAEFSLRIMSPKAIPAKTNFSKAIFDQKVNFSSASFGGDVRAHGVANFDGVAFKGDVDFSRVTFNWSVEFSSATFSGTAIFYAAKFIAGKPFGGGVPPSGVYFNSAKFSGFTNFQLAVFNIASYFSKAEFGTDVKFKKVVFGGSADFNRTIFNNASFADTKFKGLSNISYAIFNDEANFSCVEFNMNADFTATEFIKKATFSSTAFKGNADFVRAIFHLGCHFESNLNNTSEELKTETSFEGYANFETAVFKTVGDFRRVRFVNHTPAFRGCAIDRTYLKFADVETYFACERSNEEDIDNISFLKRLAEEYGQTDQALNFNAMELRAKRLQTTPQPASRTFRAVTWLYEKLSDYGRSFTRPLAWYLGLLSLSALFTMAYSTYADYPPVENQKLCKPIEGQAPLPHLSYDRAVAEYVLYRAAGLIDFTDTGKQINAVNCRLFNEPIEPWWMRIWGVFKAIASTALLFLAALGLRNKYRLK